MITIEIYTEKYKQAIAALILNIQNNEFNVPVTLADQPDLLDIENFYFKNNSSFWVAVEDEKLIGTIALIDIDNGQAALRKMFVHKDHRGKEKGVGQLLLNKLLTWCNDKNITEIYLGTVEQLHAAKRFYVKNGFVKVEKYRLPPTFPLMLVDTEFFKLQVLSDKIKKFVGKKLMFLFDTNVYRQLVRMECDNTEVQNVKLYLKFKAMVTDEIHKDCTAIRSLTVARELIGHLVEEDPNFESCKEALKLQEFHTQNISRKNSCPDIDAILPFFLYKDNVPNLELETQANNLKNLIKGIKKIVFEKDYSFVENINSYFKNYKKGIYDYINFDLLPKKYKQDEFIELIIKYYTNRTESLNEELGAIPQNKIDELKFVFKNAFSHFVHLFNAVTNKAQWVGDISNSKWNLVHDFMIVLEWCFIKYYKQRENISVILVTDDKTGSFNVGNKKMNDINDDVWKSWEYFEFFGYRINKSIPRIIEISDHGFLEQGISSLLYKISNPIWNKKS